MKRYLILALLGAAACGGKGKQEDTGPDNADTGDDTSMEDPCGGDTGMCPPEMLEEIQHSLDRKRTAATRCLTDAIDNGKADKNKKAKVTVVFVVGTDGQARDINVTKTSIDDETFWGCIRDVVASISFPNVPQDLDWSYTYAFEAF